MSEECLARCPTGTKIIVWICVAHFWILICTIVYVQLEGYAKTHHPDVITDEGELAMNLLAGYTGKYDMNNIKTSTDLHSRFRSDYKEKLKTLQYWKIRNNFNDVSKTYVFVLLSHTTIGGHGTMYLQTWPSHLFYIFTMPFGALSYFIMLHYIAAEIFEILAYAAVTIFQRPHLHWTVDQRELYEKWKVFLLASGLVICAIFTLGTIGIFSTGNYTQGVYHIMNIVFTVSCGDRLFPYQEYTHKIVAAVLTFLVFGCTLFLYTALYSVFIMFRYNGCSEIMVVLFGEDDDDELNDARTSDDVLEFDEWTQQQEQQQRKSGDNNFFTPHLNFNVQNKQNSKEQAHYRTSGTTSTSTSINSKEEESSQKRLEHMKPMTISTKGHYVQPKQRKKLDQDYSSSNPPDIQITSPSPPVNITMSDPFNEYSIIPSDIEDDKLDDDKKTKSEKEEEKHINDNDNSNGYSTKSKEDLET